MSWVVEIVSGEVPAETNAAWEFLEDVREEDELREERPEPSPEMFALYRRLTARYPCIMEDPSSPWSDGPLINNFGDKISAVGIVTSRIEEALHFVIESATDMGFTVFDGGDEAIHRPKGWRPSLEQSFSQSRRPWWQFW